MLLLLVLGLAAYANTLGNGALFDHVANPYCDPVLTNSLLQNHRLLPKVFTGEFLLATYGEYRPLGYALLGLIRPAVPAAGHWAWHILLIAMHVTTAAFVFLTFRMLIGGVTAALVFAAAYVTHPLFGPLVNDVNMIYLLWGLLFTVLTLWLFLGYLKNAAPLLLLLSLVAFAAAVFTYRYAVVIPAFLIALALLQERYSRGAATALVLMALGACVAAVLHVPALMSLAGLSVLVLIVSGAASPGKGAYRTLVKVLVPYLGVVGVFLWVSGTVEIKPVLGIALDELRDAHLIEVSQPSFASRAILTGSVPHALSLAVAALIPVVLLLKRRVRLAGAGVAVAFFFIVSIGWNGNYGDDVTYWKRLDRMREGHPAVQLNLASAYVAQGGWEPARDLLMFLAFEGGSQGRAYDAMVHSQLARVFAETGSDKAAGYYFSSVGEMSWYYGIMKHPLMQAADFYFRTGYLSCAEFNWSSALVLDPYDARLYRNLGRVLLYKNFFRAADRYFRHVLHLREDDPTALYYLAFIAKAGGNEKEYAMYGGKWRAVTHSRSEIDFREVYDAYSFDREKMRGWFSRNPAQMLYAPSPGYVVEFEGKTYTFWEVPLEIGKHFARRHNYAEAVRYLSQAREVNPNSREVLERLAEVYRQMGREDEAERLEKIAEAIADET